MCSTRLALVSEFISIRFKCFTPKFGLKCVSYFSRIHCLALIDGINFNALSLQVFQTAFTHFVTNIFFHPSHYATWAVTSALNSYRDLLCLPTCRRFGPRWLGTWRDFPEARLGKTCKHAGTCFLCSIAVRVWLFMVLVLVFVGIAVVASNPYRASLLHGFYWSRLP